MYIITLTLITILLYGCSSVYNMKCKSPCAYPFLYKSLYFHIQFQVPSRVDFLLMSFIYGWL